jgi:hypothetical protein
MLYFKYKELDYINNIPIKKSSSRLGLNDK